MSNLHGGHQVYHVEYSLVQAAIVQVGEHGQTHTVPLARAVTLRRYVGHILQDTEKHSYKYI